MAPTRRTKQKSTPTKTTAKGAARKAQAARTSPTSPRGRKRANVHRALTKKPPRVIGKSLSLHLHIPLRCLSLIIPQVEDEDDEDEDLDLDEEFGDESTLDALDMQSPLQQYGFDDDEGDDEDDEDLADEQAVVPVRRRKSVPSPKFSMSASTPVSRVAQRAPVTPSRLRTPANPLQRAALRYTPYENRVNPRDPSKPLLTKQSPLSQNLLKRSMQKYRADTITRAPFMDEDARVRTATSIFHNVARELDADRRIYRFEDDLIYQENILKMIKRADSQVRGEVVSAARDIVGACFGLGPGRGDVGDNKRYVLHLLANMNFVFLSLMFEELDDGTLHNIQRTGPYRNAIFATLIQQEFFHNHEQMAVAELTANLFNPMPLVVIAFVATAVQCALQDWTTGVRIKSSSDFTVEDWADVYDRHVNALEQMRDRNKQGFVAWTRKLYRNCWATTRQSLANDPQDGPSITAEEMDSYDDVEGLADEYDDEP
ncbi:hypothetical protein EXIGLDRAFT_763439 [Exidia glandulosa HHB12029]|uniref:DUF6532 domain-containing protein n=1 Tax=Exidia glandulosa HHB12029 TaxID=1314781 RepID=A0A165M0L0_EXIGL|nr:hypothetical protein EXIGLDRAFT_763439 [Exidia glandulosa HHB12029]